MSAKWNLTADHHWRLRGPLRCRCDLMYLKLSVIGSPEAVGIIRTFVTLTSHHRPSTGLQACHHVTHCWKQGDLSAPAESWESDHTWNQLKSPNGTTEGNWFIRALDPTKLDVILTARKPLGSCTRWGILIGCLVGSLGGETLFFFFFF